MTYFPKNNIKQSIKKQVLPKSDWEVYQVRRLALKNIPNYAKAIKKQKMALLTSGVDTDDENEGMQIAKSKEKKKSYKQPSRAIEYIDSGPSNVEGSSESFTSRYEMPSPLVFTESTNRMPSTSRSAQSHGDPFQRKQPSSKPQSVQIEDDSTPSRSRPAQSHGDPFQLKQTLSVPQSVLDEDGSTPSRSRPAQSHGDPIQRKQPSSSQSVQIEDITDISEHVQFELMDGSSSAMSRIDYVDVQTPQNENNHIIATSYSPNLCNATPIRSIVPAALCDLAERPRAIEMSNAEMRRTLTDLVNMVKDVKEMQNVILAKLDEIPGSTQFELELVNDLALPVQSKEDMDELAVVLKNDRSKRRKLRNYLSRLGGTSASEVTYNVMKACMTYQTACLYSFVGQREKIGFQSHPLYEVVVQACMTIDKKSTRKTFDDIIATFLKNAPSKEGCPKYKGKKKLSMAKSLPVISSTDGSETE